MNINWYKVIELYSGQWYRWKFSCIPYFWKYSYEELLRSSRKAWLSITILSLHSPFLLPTFWGVNNNNNKYTFLTQIYFCILESSKRMFQPGFWVQRLFWFLQLISWYKMFVLKLSGIQIFIYLLFYRAWWKIYHLKNYKS